MAEKNKVEVRIAGKDYTLVGCESEEYIQKVALYIDKKMTEIMRMNNKLSTSMHRCLPPLMLPMSISKLRRRLQVSAGS